MVGVTGTISAGSWSGGMADLLLLIKSVINSKAGRGAAFYIEGFAPSMCAAGVVGAMAKIFPVYGGEQHGSWGELPWSKCVEAFELDELCRTEDRPVFDGGDKTAVFPDRVVVQIEAPEATQHGIKPGFFVSPLDGLTAKLKLDDARGA